MDGADGRAAARNQVRWLLAAVAATVLGAKLVVVAELGSAMPFLDQWDAEAANLYAPYLHGTLTFSDLFASHNEHRIVLTRLLALAELELAGEWNPRLQMIVNAVIHTALVTWLAALLMPLVRRDRRMLLACFVALVFALPIAYENTLWGFQSQLYLMLLFGLAAIVAFVGARALSVRWFAGLAAAVLGYLSYSAGAVAVLAAAVVVGVQLATKARRRSPAEYGALAVLAAVFVAMILWVQPSQTEAPGPLAVVLGFLLIAGPSIVGVLFVQVPVFWFAGRAVAARPALTDRVWPVVGIAGWVVAQLALIAYGRGTVMAVRYFDVLLISYPVALVAVLALYDRAQSTRFRRFAAPATIAWVFAVVAALSALGILGSLRQAIDWDRARDQQIANVSAYLATGDLGRLRMHGDGGAFTFDVPYPDAGRLAGVLGDAEVRSILPHEFRPPNADGVGAREHLWLKGSLANITADGVQVILLGGPALLAVGVGVFFAAGARRSLGSAELAETPVE